MTKSERPMNNARRMNTAFEDILKFDLHSNSRLKLTSKATITTARNFIDAATIGVLYRIYGWISNVHPKQKTLSIIDGSGELVGLRCQPLFSVSGGKESLLYEFACVDLALDDALILSTTTHVNLQTPKRRSMPWCAALGVALGDTEERVALVEEKPLHGEQSHKDGALMRPVSEQIRLDVARAFCFPAGLHLSKSSLDTHRQRLFRLICMFSTTNKHYHYFQGFHEICSLFLLVFEGNKHGDRMAEQALQLFADSRLRPFLLPNFDARLASYAGAVVFMARRFKLRSRSVLAECDERESAAFDGLIARVRETIDLHGLLASWFLTWFANEFTDFSDSLTVFDFQMTRLKTHLAPIYIAAALLVVAKRQLMEMDGESFELILAIRTLPKTLSRGQIPLVLEAAQSLYSRHSPPERLIRRDRNLRLGKSRGYGRERLAVFRDMLPLRFFGGSFWVAVIASHLLYYLVIAYFPGLRNY